jgi:hypothetical protein
MTRKKRAQNARAEKDRRTKMVAIGLSVVLVAVLALEVPKMMHSSSSSTPPAATTTTDATAATGAPVTTAPGTAAAASMPTTSTKVPNSDPLPQSSKGTLDSFSHFTGKDPFAQQINNAATPTSTTTPSSGTLSANVSSGSSASSAGSRAHHPSRTLAATGAARISVNGRVQVVRVGASFPSANPLFRLVGLAHGGVRIGIASGSYTSGAQTVSLTLGRTLTLVDTADGVRYKIRLLTAS